MRVALSGSCWVKLSYSQSETACVEASCSQEGVAMRDSVNRGLGILEVSFVERDAFIRDVRESG